MWLSLKTLLINCWTNLKFKEIARVWLQNSYFIWNIVIKTYVTVFKKKIIHHVILVKKLKHLLFMLLLFPSLNLQLEATNRCNKLE